MSHPSSMYVCMYACIIPHQYVIVIYTHHPVMLYLPTLHMHSNTSATILWISRAIEKLSCSPLASMYRYAGLSRYPGQPWKGAHHLEGFGAPEAIFRVDGWMEGWREGARGW